MSFNTFVYKAGLLKYLTLRVVMLAMLVALFVHGANAGTFVVPVDNSTVKVYYVSEPLRELYSYKVVELTTNMTEEQFTTAFDAAKPVFAGDINPDVRKSFPLKAYNLATDVYGNSP